MKKKLLAVATAVATLPAAYAVDIKAGDWDLSIGGNANAFYTSTKCTGDSVDGLALGGKALACSGKARSTTVGNGLLPTMLNVGAKTRQDGYDISAVIGIGLAVATDSAQAPNGNVDTRQAFLTFGNKDMGTVKLGRDFGLFGLQPVLNDMTLLGVGVPAQAIQVNRVALGHIGAGYAYAGQYGQVAYALPSLGDVNVDVALVSPVNAYAQSTTGANSGAASTGPGVQARATYGSGGIKLWVANKSQDFATYRMNASEVGGTLAAGPFGLLANYQTGNGLGLVGDGDQGDIKSTNTFVQGTYKATSKLKLGVGMGKGTNDKTAVGANFKSNESTTLGAYYNLTSSLTLVGEVGTIKSKSFTGGLEGKQSSMTVGGIFFF